MISFVNEISVDLDEFLHLLQVPLFDGFEESIWARFFIRWRIFPKRSIHVNPIFEPEEPGMKECINEFSPQFLEQVHRIFIIYPIDFI